MRLSAIGAVLLALMGAPSDGPSRASRPCTSVVSYFADPYQGSRITKQEWRVFDPSSRTDTLFLAFAGGFEGVRWDTMFRAVFFDSGDSLYRVDWKLGAKPRLVSRFPRVQGRQDWWFNPDSACWQLAAMRPIGPAQTSTRYWCELWQSSPNAASWHRVRSDTVPCESDECDTWPWYNKPFARRAVSKTLGDLEDDAKAGAWFERTLPFDTAAVAVGGDESSEWRFLEVGESTHRGLVFRFMASDQDVVCGPIYFVDLGTRTKTEVPIDPNDKTGWYERLVSERCGLLLVPGASGNPIVVDARSGRVLFSRTWFVSRAVWVVRPG